MPTCTFCGSANSPDATHCSLCAQELLREPVSDQLDPTIGARISRYGNSENTPDRTAASSNWTGDDAGAPPPGWGTVGSSSWGTQRQVARRTYEQPKKRKKSRASRSNPFAYFRLAVILVVVAALIILGATSQIGKTTLNIALITQTDKAVVGTFEVLDEDHNVIGSTEIRDPGSKCGSGRLSNFKVRTKSVSQYYFRYQDAVAGPLDSSTIKAAQHNITINDSSRGIEATVDRPRTCI